MSKPDHEHNDVWILVGLVWIVLMAVAVGLSHDIVGLKRRVAQLEVQCGGQR